MKKLAKKCEICIGRKISKTQQSRKYFSRNTLSRKKKKHYETYKKFKSLLYHQTHTHPRFFLQIKWNNMRLSSQYITGRNLSSEKKTFFWNQKAEKLKKISSRLIKFIRSPSPWKFTQQQKFMRPFSQFNISPNLSRSSGKKRKEKKRKKKEKKCYHEKLLFF